MKVYQKKRIHSSLGYLTPAEFKAAWKSQTKPSQKTKRREQPQPASAAAVVKGHRKSVVPLTTVLAGAEVMIGESKVLPVPRRNKDFKERSEFLKIKTQNVSSLIGPLHVGNDDIV